MIDLFGLDKNPDPQKPERASVPSPMLQSAAKKVEPPPHAPRGSHKLWAFLLVLDSVFVIVFAGAVAAKVYQHWTAPALAPKPSPRRRSAPPTPVSAPIASTAPAAQPAKAPQPPKPAPDVHTSPRPPKPSMLAEAPKPRAMPRPADAGGKAASVAAENKVKALRTEFKIHASKAKAVELVGAFIVHGGRKEMIRQDDGTWAITLYLNPGSYRYFFSVDKKKQLDPENPHSQRDASLLTVP